MKRCPRFVRPAFPLQSLLAAAVLTAVAASMPAQVPAGLRFAELAKWRLPVDYGYTAAVAYGDVDGDGDLDMVAGNFFGLSGGAQNRLYINDGRGVFTDVTNTQMPVDGDATFAVVLVDVDGDGDLDLICGNGTSTGQQNRLYLNDGAGVFTDATASQLPVASDVTRAITFGDVDGDGDLDLVFGNVGQNRLYLNNGSGVFTDATAARMPVDVDTTVAIKLVDVDGDGDLDLICGNGDQHAEQSRLYLNNGSGVFTDVTSTQMPVVVDDTRSIAVGDVDGDGDLDIVFGNGGQNRLYLNNGSGVFTVAAAAQLPVAVAVSVALGDVDGDGDLDLFCGEWGQDRLFLNNGSGTFTDVTAARMPVDADDSVAVAFGDVDGDGDLDLLFGNTPYPSPFGSYYGPPAGQNRLYLNDGAGTFTDGSVAQVPIDHDLTSAVALGDVDGDGDLDLVCGNGGSQNRLYWNDGAGTFTDVTAAQVPVDNDATSAVALGDVDGDGDLDLVCGNGGGQDRLYLNDGTGHFTDVTGMQMPVNIVGTSALVLGDVDGDGDLDLVLASAGHQDRLYLNDGTGHFTDGTVAQMPAYIGTTSSLALGDVDGDGDLDLVLGQSAGGTTDRLYLNNGSGTFTDATATSGLTGTLTTSLALGDVDGDGDLDLVVCRLTFGAAGVYYGRHALFENTGNGTFLDVTATLWPASTARNNVVTLGDVDGDGDLDIVTGTQWGAYSQDGGQLFLNDGVGNFTDVTATQNEAIAEDTLSIALGDVDGDGDLDVVLGDVFQNRLHVNLQRQLHAPTPLRIGQPYRLDAYLRYGPPSLLDLAAIDLSTAPASIPLPPFGTLRIDLAQAAPFPTQIIPQPVGVSSVTWTVPNLPTLVGMPLYAQALHVALPNDLRLSNVVVDVVK